jgi:hypothetical protein
MESERAQVPADTRARVDDPVDGDAKSTSLVRWVPTIWLKRRPKKMITVIAVLTLVVVTIVGVAAYSQQQRSLAPLNSERARLRHAQSVLLTARSHLDAVKGQSDAAGHSLESATNQLAADQTKLAHAQAEVFAQGVTISQLDPCLSGVEKSLTQISLGDQAAAAATLSGVAAICQSVEPSGP